MKRLTCALAFLTFICSSLQAGEAALDRTFEEQFGRVTAYLADNHLAFKAERFPAGGRELVAALLAIEDGTYPDTDLFTQATEAPALKAADPAAYTSIILNPVIDGDSFLYPLLFGDVRDFKRINGVILFTAESGRIVRAQVMHAITPDFIVKLIDDSFFPDEAEISMDMIDKKTNGKETSFSFNIFSVRSFASVMEFTAPKRELGKKILLKEGSLWMYSPQVSRPVRLSNRQKFMGSSFSNNDLMDTSLADDYTITVDTLEPINDVPCLKLTLVAKSTDVTYPKMEIWLRTDNLIAMRMNYYTPSGRILKTMETRSIKLLGGRMRASELVMINMFEQDASTTVVMQSIAVKPIPRKVFTESYLKR